MRNSLNIDYNSNVVLIENEYDLKQQILISKNNEKMSSPQYFEFHKKMYGYLKY